jgi:LPS-assembly lipoprotein
MSSSEIFTKNAITVATLLVFLAGCGFQMRGTRSVPAEMSRTYIETADRHSLFYRQLRADLLSADVELVESPLDASATFSIISDITGQRVLSVSARNVPREFEVFYTVMYSLKTEKETLLDPRSQTLIRDYTWDETEVLGKEKEEQLMREAIVGDIVRTVLIQLSAL